MATLLYLALILNICVLVPVTIGIAGGQAWADAAYGADSAARRIVLSFYAAILFASIALLPLLALAPDRTVPWVQALLAVQILYKLATVFLIGPGNPVVSANLGIALFHVAALALSLRL